MMKLRTAALVVGLIAGLTLDGLLISAVRACFGVAAKGQRFTLLRIEIP